MTSGVAHHYVFSLLHGWIPGAVQLLAGAVVVAAGGGRTRRWQLIWLPLAALAGAALAATAYVYLTVQGLTGNPAPTALWVWVVATGATAVVLVAGWHGSRWWRRAVAVLAVPLCLASATLALNRWVGYFPTVQTAWDQLTAGPLPDQVDPVAVTAMQQRHAVPVRGTVLAVSIGDRASGFRHRGELVYLPPAWYRSDPPPALPTIMMIGGEFNTPADWLRTGQAVATVDAFAASHSGDAPVLVFVDAGGAFNNDTECVDGPRGRSADHLTKDVVPYMVSRFKVSPDPSRWAVVGWSMGGTCAVDLVVMHPELFGTFEDIAGDIGPNAGNRAQTVARLFGGSTAAWAAFDPRTVITRHRSYAGVAGWFAVNEPGPGKPNPQAVAAASLCAAGRAHGIRCAVVTRAGQHNWPFAAHAFSAALPWLAGRLGTPGATPTNLPGSAGSRVA